jgi:polygalacturonase
MEIKMNIPKNVIKIIFLTALVACQLAGYGSDRGSTDEFNILRFGAIGDGKTLNTKAIQQAIDAVSEAGGGKLIVPEGTFLSGSLFLKSNVNLHLEKNATLLGSLNPDDYQSVRRKGFLLADKQKNISITGKGTIDGQGRALALRIDSLFYEGKLDSAKYNRSRRRANENARPQNIVMVECHNVVLRGINIKNSACWVQTYDRCENLVIDGVTVESDAYWNNDGIDISDCKHVRITNCFVNAADDGICLKSHTPGLWNDDIYIADCTVRSSASAIKFGTASFGGFRNVTIKNIKVFDTFRSAIAIESVDGGVLENVVVDGIRAVNTGNAIFIRLGHRNVKGRVGTLRNVSLKNISVQVPFGRPDEKYEIRGPDTSDSHNPLPSSITGIPGHCVENVTLENIEIIFPGRGNNGLAYIPLNRLNAVPERESHYPEFSMFGELPSWGIYVRHVEGLKMKNISFQVLDKDYRPACVFDDVTKLDLSGIEIIGNGNTPQIVLKNVSKEKLLIDKKTVKVIGK